jgi:hypothetical protein
MFGIPFLTSGLLVKIGCVLAIVGAISFAGFEVVHSIRADAVKSIVAQDAVVAATAKAAGAAQDAASADADLHATETSSDHQTQLAAQAARVKAKVKAHVHEPPPPTPADPPRIGCVSYGLVRQHDAAALGVDPDTLPLPAGSSDDACSPVTNSALADAISDNYAAARANAQELTDLQARDTAQVDAHVPKP